MATTIMRRPPSPLGLPPGSVRAILALLLCGSLWYEVLGGVALSRVLLDSALLVVAFYFGVRSTAPPGQPVADRQRAPVKYPLHLPRGTIRGVLLVGFFGVIGFVWLKDRTLDQEFALILQVLGSYIVGFGVARAVERRRRKHKRPSILAAIFRNLNALVAVSLTTYMCGVLLGGWAEALPPQYARYTGNALAWVIAFYFGSRVSQ